MPAIVGLAKNARGLIVSVEGRFHRGKDPHREQRMPSQREEVVVHPDSIDAKRVGKDCCETNLDIVARRDEVRVDGEALLIGLPASSRGRPCRAA